MIKKMTTEYPAIGKTVYAVAKRYATAKDKSGARILVCKVKTYINRDGKVVPVLKEPNTKGTQSEITASIYDLFIDLNAAILAIADKPEKKIVVKKKK